MQRCLKENTAKKEHEPAQAHIRLLSVRVSGSLLFIYIGLSKLKARTHPPPPPFPPGKRTAVAWQLPHWHPSAQQPPFLPAVHVPQIRMQLPTSIAPEGKMEEKKKKGIFLVRRFVYPPMVGTRYSHDWHAHLVRCHLHQQVFPQFFIVNVSCFCLYDFQIYSSARCLMRDSTAVRHATAGFFWCCWATGATPHNHDLALGTSIATQTFSVDGQNLQEHPRCCWVWCYRCQVSMGNVQCSRSRKRVLI